MICPNPFNRRFGIDTRMDIVTQIEPMPGYIECVSHFSHAMRNWVLKLLTVPPPERTRIELKVTPIQGALYTPKVAEALVRHPVPSGKWNLISAEE